MPGEGGGRSIHAQFILRVNTRLRSEPTLYIIIICGINIQAIVTLYSIFTSSRTNIDKQGNADDTSIRQKSSPV